MHAVLCAALTLPALSEVIEAMPVILSLVVIEGLLSVDNALAIAAMASHLPQKQKFLALRFGILGAYLFRGLSLMFAAWIIENPWLKMIGAAYLLYLMADHFEESAGESEGAGAHSTHTKGFWATIVAIEVMDLSLSVDNVVAAVAMSPKLWVVCAGVFIGILALRFVAGACIRLMERFPVLESTAFVLIGYVGVLLLVEVLSDPHHSWALFDHPIHFGTFQKFLGIVGIITVSILHSRNVPVQKALEPVLRASRYPMRGVTRSVGFFINILVWPFRAAAAVFPRKPE